MTARFVDRADAGRRLAEAVAVLGLPHPMVLGLPRGGVPVAFEVAGRLGAPLDVAIVCKVGAPRQPELGIGAVTEAGGVTIDPASALEVGADRTAVAESVARSRGEVERRVECYRSGKPFPALAGRDVVIVDDGLATGVTASAATDLVRAHGPRQVVLAVAVGAPVAVDRFRQIADDVVCVLQPARFRAVGLWYQRFDQTTDEDVLDLLVRAARRSA